MSRNGPLALAFHALFVIFMLAPIVVVCWVAFTPEGYLSFPTDRWSLRWFEAIARYPEFIAAFWRSLRKHASFCVTITRPRIATSLPGKAALARSVSIMCMSMMGWTRMPLSPCAKRVMQRLACPG